MKHIFFYSILCCFGLMRAANEKRYSAPRQHLSIYDTDFDSMEPWQLKERAEIIKHDMIERNKNWLNEKPWRKTVRCVGINCSFWVTGGLVSYAEFATGMPSIFNGLCGLIAGACVMNVFSNRYRPQQPFREQDLEEINGILQKKKIKDD